MSVRDARFILLYPRLQFPPGVTIKPDGSLSLPYLAGALRQAGFEVKIVDCAVGTDDDRLEDTFYRAIELPSSLVRIGMSDDRILEEVAGYDVVGITSIFTMQTTPVLEMIRLIKRAYPEKTIIAGGVNARELRKRFLDAGADWIFLSEAERALVAFARLGKGDRSSHELFGVANRTAISPAGPPLDDLDQLPIPAWDLLPNERYWQIGRPHGGDFPPGTRIPYASMMTSRGCPFSCAYCHISKETDGDLPGAIGSLRLKSINRVLEEARMLKALGVEYLFLEDDSLLAKKKRVIEILERFRTLDLRLIDVNGVNLAHLTRKVPGGGLEVDTDLLDAMAAAGFEKLSLPFEAGTQRVIDRWASRKWRLDLIDTSALIRACEDRGIETVGNYTIGYPDETFAEITKTILMAQRHRDAGLRAAAFFTIVPFPGTVLFDEALRAGQLDPNFNPDNMNWTHSLFQNTPVSAEALEHIREIAWRLLNRSDHVVAKTRLSPVPLAPGNP